LVIPAGAFLGKIKMHSEKSTVDFPNLRIISLPAASDNFMYLVVDKTSQQAFVVDPLEPETVIQEAKEQNVTLQGILTTHHHWDHSGGNEKLVQMYAAENDGSKLKVYGGDDRIGGLTNKVGQGDNITLGSLNFDCLFTPCHTSGHICYYLKTLDSHKQKPAVFTGDTMFIGGCGRFFEGTAEQMHSALIDKLGNLPDETLVFCGHEYTVNNLKFALSVEPNNEAMTKKMAWSQDKRSQNLPTVPSTIGEEKEINPFMRCIHSDVQKKVGASDAFSCMKTLRAMKDKF